MPIVSRFWVCVFGRICFKKVTLTVFSSTFAQITLRCNVWFFSRVEIKTNFATILMISQAFDQDICMIFFILISFLMPLYSYLVSNARMNDIFNLIPSFPVKVQWRAFFRWFKFSRQWDSAAKQKDFAQLLSLRFLFKSWTYSVTQCDSDWVSSITEISIIRIICIWIHIWIVVQII